MHMNYVCSVFREGAGKCCGMRIRGVRIMNTRLDSSSLKNGDVPLKLTWMLLSMLMGWDVNSSMWTLLAFGKYVKASMDGKAVPYLNSWMAHRAIERFAAGLVMLSFFTTFLGWLTARLSGLQPAL